MVYTWDGQPTLARFWPRFLDSTQDTDIVLADTSFAIVEDMMKRSFPLTDYLNRNYLSEVRTYSLCTADNKVVNSIPFESIAARNNGSFGDFQVAQRIEALDHGSTSAHVSFAREFTADSVKRDNVILIGSRKSNPWVDLFTDEMNFLVRYDASLDQSFVENLHPRAGEQAQYAQPADPYASLGYGVIAYLAQSQPHRKRVDHRRHQRRGHQCRWRVCNVGSDHEQFPEKGPGKQDSLF